MRRYAGTIAGLCCFAILAALCADDATAHLYQLVLHGWGVQGFATPFLDFAGYLASLNCTRLGVDVIAGNPCDPLERQFNYGPLWLDLTFLPLYPPYRMVGGVAVGLLFLLSLSALPPARRGWDVVVTVLASISTAVVFAVERGNPDILIFLLTLAVALLAERGGMARGVGYGLIWFMAGLKFYPAALLALTLRERLARFWLVFGASVLLAGVYLWRYRQELERILPLLPVGNFDSDLYGAKNLPMRLGLVSEAAWGTPAELMVGLAVLFVLLARLVWRVRRLLRDGAFQAALAGLPARVHLLLLAGALPTVFCFFAGQNIGYRAILLLLALPGLLALPAQAGVAVLFVLWEGAVRHALDSAIAFVGMADGTAFVLRLVYWVGRELAWWWLIGVLLVVVLRFAWLSPVGRAVRR